MIWDKMMSNLQLAMLIHPGNYVESHKKSKLFKLEESDYKPFSNWEVFGTNDLSLFINAAAKLLVAFYDHGYVFIKFPYKILAIDVHNV
jgi:hypothetical protein